MFVSTRGHRVADPSRREPLGQVLLRNRWVDPGNLLKALAMQGRESAQLGDILLAHGWISEASLMSALSQQWHSGVINPGMTRPDPRLIDLLGAEECLREGLLPWRQAGAATVVATARPDKFANARPRLEQIFGPVLMALAKESDLHAAISASRQTALNLKAESMVPLEESCRAWNVASLRQRAAGLCVCFVLLAALLPTAVSIAVLSWSVVTLVACTGLKLAAVLATFKGRRGGDVGQRSAGPTSIARLPTVSIMVPMFHEEDIARRLMDRLGRLDYPRELLDILLVVEAEDALTRRALACTALPRWMRVVVVPPGQLKTKPRALNYALHFCRGTIIGIYDAEDAPEPAQLHKVVRRFHERGPQVACLQGILDFYNPRTNWLARCFTMEYACWFRMVLPGMERLGLAIPLGGTTLFLRRDALEKVGGWDAHNVTEDADLGMRLARHGYRSELVDTVTEEEANCRAWPWVKQRSRWIKGYAMTYAVLMRDPVLLWRQLGPRRFLGTQILFLGSLSQVLLAPFLWTFWLAFFGIWHPMTSMLGPSAMFGLSALFVLSEGVNLVAGFCALSTAKHRSLRFWLPSLILYFPLATLAAYKAFHELITQPFFWDKTAHGLEQGEDMAEQTDEAA